MDIAVFTGTDPVSLVGMVLFVTQVLKSAICGSDPALTDRYGRLIALVVAVSFSVLYVAFGDSFAYHTIVSGVVNALAAMGVYQVTKVTINRVLAPKVAVDAQS